MQRDLPISDRAKDARRKQFLLVASKLDIISMTELSILGAMLYIAEQMNRLPAGLRAALAATTIIAGGYLVVLSLHYQIWGLALVVMFILGYLVSEIRKL